MKIRRILIPVIFHVLFLGLYAQLEKQGETFNLYYNVDWDALYTAKNEVTLSPGFSMKATSSEEFDAKIDPGLTGYPSNDLSNGLPTGYEQSASGEAPPGSLPSVIDVSPSGAAVVNFPLEFPRGFANMGPNLSVNYNSQAGRGLFGKGWSLSGLSVISRIPKDEYYNEDDDGGPVSLTHEDRFSLDGSRLVLLNGTYGQNNAQYTKESTDFTDIRSYGTGVNGPDYFQVTTRDQTVFHYGKLNSETDANLVAPGTGEVLSWYIKRITDARGNYMVFNYNATVNGQMRISSIEYTYNEHDPGVNQQYIIAFNYSTFPTEEIAYIGGAKIINDQYITSISCSNSSSYEFGYSSSKLLTSISYKKAGNKLVCKPTTINWNSFDDDPEVIPNLESFDGSSHLLDYKKGYVSSYTADFDGDGKNELLRISQYENSWKMYRYSSGNLALIDQGNLPSGHKYTLTTPVIFDCESYSTDQNRRVVKSCDVGTSSQTVYLPYVVYDADYDGIMEICYVKKLNSTDFGYATYKYESGDFQPMGSTYFHNDIGNINYDSRFILGDFNGDGFNDPILLDQGSSTQILLPNIRLNKVGFSFRQVISANFNNDRKTDLITVTSNGVYVYQPVRISDGVYTFQQIAYLALNSTEGIQMGDFNGDNLTDILAYNTSTSDWELYYANGIDDFEQQPASFTASLNIGNDDTKSPTAVDFLSFQNKFAYEQSGGLQQYAPSTNNSLYVTADFDADGKTDVVKISRRVSNTTYPYEDDFVINYSADVFYSDGIGFDKTHVEGEEIYYEDVTTDIPEHRNPGNLLSNIQFVQDIRFNQLTYQITDINSDGFPEFFYSNSGSITDMGLNIPNAIHTAAIQFYSTNSGKKVGSILDGMEVKTQFTYNNLLEYSGYTQGARVIESNSIFSKEVPLNVVTSVSVNLSLNNPGYISYKRYYYNSAMFSQRRGFLGFKSITVDDTETKQKVYTETTVADRNDKVVAYPSLIKAYKNNIQLSEKVNTFDIYYTSNNSWYFQKLTFTSETNKLTNTTIHTDFEYDNDNGDLENKTTTYGNDGTVSEAYTRNSAGLPTNIIKTRTIDGNSFVTTKDINYDAYNNQSTVTDNDGIITEYFYEPNHTNLTYKIFDRSGINTRTDYQYGHGKRFCTQEKITYSDAAGTEVVKYYTYDWDGRLLSKEDSEGYTTSYQYDLLGKLEVKAFPNGRREAYSYGWAEMSNTWYSITRDDIGNKSRKEYDKVSRLKFNSSKPVGGYEVTATQVYNDDGTLASIVSSIDGTTSYTYRNDGRVQSVSSMGQTVSYSYSGKTTSTTKNGQTSSKILNAFGQVVNASDEGGSITYNYHANGSPESITSNGAEVNMTYYPDGRQHFLTDPDAGQNEYAYDWLGRISTQTDASGNTTSFEYDKLGRNHRKTITNGTNGSSRLITYDFDPNYPARIITETDHESGVVINYGYDALGNVNSVTETIDGTDYTTNYTYDVDGNLTAIEYPDGYTVNYEYTGSYLKEVSDDEITLFHTFTYNNRGQVTQYHKANSKTRTNTYDEYGYITSSLFGDMYFDRIEYSYDFDHASGLLNSRTKEHNSASVTESFTYDNVNRLTNWQVSQGGTQTNYEIDYQSNGNITYKEDMGLYEYNESDKPHAVRNIHQLSGTAVDSRDCDIAYNAVNLTEQITISNSGTPTDIYQITYGPDDVRRITSHNGQQTIYTGAYELRGNGDRLHYVNINEGLGLIYITNPSEGTDERYYVETDYLGSIIAITNESGRIVREFSYDPWGRRRNPSNWNDYNVTAENTFTRGFTGHEHLDAYGLINMNGRVYDARMGRFLSPDNFVQNPYFSQNFNRYSYGYNNPLMYVDPSGEIAWFVPVIIGAAVGGFSGWQIGKAAGAEGWEMAGYIGGGALIGGLSGGAASGISAAGGGAMLAGAGAGAVGGAGFSGLATGWDGQAMIKGAAIGTAAGFVGGGIATGIGGPGGAFAGGFASSTTSQLLGTGEVDFSRSLLAGGISFGMYHGFQYAQWKWGGGNRIGDFDITYKQFSKINTMYQRSQSWLGSRNENGCVLNPDYKDRGNNWGYMIDRADRYPDHVDFRGLRGDQIAVHSHVNNSSVTHAFPSHSPESWGGVNSDAVSLRGYHSLVVSPTGSSTMMGYQTNPNVLIQSSPYVRFFLFPWLDY